MILARILMIALAVVTGSASAFAQDKIKVGYWTSGFSVGFGAVLELGKFLEKQGLQPEFVKFSDVNGPTKAIITNSIDVAFAAPTTGAFALGIDGAPIETILATQVAEATFVSLDGSPVKAIADLKGKKIGMSPVGSATYAIAAAVLEKNYGIKPTDYTPVPGNEGALVRLLAQGSVDAASLRAVTLATSGGTNFHKLGGVVDEWKKMTKSSAVPILGSAIVHKTYAQQHPEAVVKFVRAVIEATKFGAAEPDKASEMLRSAANLDAKDALAYVKLWNEIYIATMEPQDVATYKAMAQIFKASKTIEGDVPDSLFVTKYYEQAKRAP